MRCPGVGVPGVPQGQSRPAGKPSSPCLPGNSYLAYDGAEMRAAAEWSRETTVRAGQREGKRLQGPGGGAERRGEERGGEAHISTVLQSSLYFLQSILLRLHWFCNTTGPG